MTKPPTSSSPSRSPTPAHTNPASSAALSSHHQQHLSYSQLPHSHSHSPSPAPPPLVPTSQQLQQTATPSASPTVTTPPTTAINISQQQSTIPPLAPPQPPSAYALDYMAAATPSGQPPRRNTIANLLSHPQAAAAAAAAAEQQQHHHSQLHHHHHLNHPHLQDRYTDMPTSSPAHTTSPTTSSRRRRPSTFRASSASTEQHQQHQHYQHQHHQQHQQHHHQYQQRQQRQQPLTPSLPDDQRRAAPPGVSPQQQQPSSRLSSRATSVHGHTLGVSRSSSKSRMSRSKSSATPARQAAMRAAAAAVTGGSGSGVASGSGGTPGGGGGGNTSAPSSAAGTAPPSPSTHHHHQIHQPHSIDPSTVPGPNILRAISTNSMPPEYVATAGGHHHHHHHHHNIPGSAVGSVGGQQQQQAQHRRPNSASNSADSCVPPLGADTPNTYVAATSSSPNTTIPVSKAILHAAARNLVRNSSTDFPSRASRSIPSPGLTTSGSRPIGRGGGASPVIAGRGAQQLGGTFPGMIGLSSRDAMDVDMEMNINMPSNINVGDAAEPSSSSHDARLAQTHTQHTHTQQTTGQRTTSAIDLGRSKTTPDAKRAQNRESAKRFRVAQKKRWAELNDALSERDAEIEKLKEMLQDVTNSSLNTMRVNTEDVPDDDADAADDDDDDDDDENVQGTATTCTTTAKSKQKKKSISGAAGKLEAVNRVELDLFSKLLGPSVEGSGIGGSSSHMSTGGGGPGEKSSSPQRPLAADIGSLYRVMISKLDGSVLGVRHENSINGGAKGGDVGGCLWEHIHHADSAHLKASVVHANTMLKMMDGQPMVFSYRRRKRTIDSGDGKDSKDHNKGSDDIDHNPNVGVSSTTKGADKIEYIRMKGCLYPIQDDTDDVNSVILAEFIEL